MPSLSATVWWQSVLTDTLENHAAELARCEEETSRLRVELAAQDGTIEALHAERDELRKTIQDRLGIEDVPEAVERWSYPDKFGRRQPEGATASW